MADMKTSISYKKFKKKKTTWGVNRSWVFLALVRDSSWKVDLGINLNEL